MSSSVEPRTEKARIVTANAMMFRRSNTTVTEMPTIALVCSGT